MLLWRTLISIVSLIFLLGDMNKCPFTKDRVLKTDHSSDSAKVQLSEPVNLLGFLIDHRPSLQSLIPHLWQSHGNWIIVLHFQFTFHFLYTLASPRIICRCWVGDMPAVLGRVWWLSIVSFYQGMQTASVPLPSYFAVLFSLISCHDYLAKLISTSRWHHAMARTKRPQGYKYTY